MSMYRTIRTLTVLLATLVACPFLSNDAFANPAKHRVMAFYYPWYGTADGPGGAGRTIHWGKIDAENQDLAASTHYPALGATTPTTSRSSTCIAVRRPPPTSIRSS